VWTGEGSDWCGVTGIDRNLTWHLHQQQNDFKYDVVRQLLRFQT